MKKYLIILLGISLVFGTIGCSSSKDNEESSEISYSPSAPPEKTKTDPKPKPLTIVGKWKLVGGKVKKSNVEKTISLQELKKGEIIEFTQQNEGIIWSRTQAIFYSFVDLSLDLPELESASELYYKEKMDAEVSDMGKQLEAQVSIDSNPSDENIETHTNILNGEFLKVLVEKARFKFQKTALEFSRTAKADAIAVPGYQEERAKVLAALQFLGTEENSSEFLVGTSFRNNDDNTQSVVERGYCERFATSSGKKLKQPSDFTLDHSNYAQIVELHLLHPLINERRIQFRDNQLTITFDDSDNNTYTFRYTRYESKH